MGLSKEKLEEFREITRQANLLVKEYDVQLKSGETIWKVYDSAKNIRERYGNSIASISESIR